MANPKNPFLDFDVQKLMGDFKFPGVDMDAFTQAQKRMIGDFKMPGMDVEAYSEAQRKNMEAVTSAQQMALEGLQAIARRQTEIMQKAAEQVQSGARGMIEPGQPDDMMAKNAALLKQNFESAVSNIREMSEMMVKSQNEAIDVIYKRFAESLDELSSAAKPKK